MKQPDGTHVSLCDTQFVQFAWGFCLVSVDGGGGSAHICTSGYCVCRQGGS